MKHKVQLTDKEVALIRFAIQGLLDDESTDKRNRKAAESIMLKTDSANLGYQVVD